MNYIINAVNIITLQNFIELNNLNILLCKLNHIKFNLVIIYINLLNFYYYTTNVICLTLFTLIQFINFNAKHNYILNNFYIGYYKNHPLLLYISTIFILFKKSNNKIFAINWYKILILSIVTFILGSLWALVQFIWGKYWSYDTIEFALLLMSLYITMYIHQLIKRTYKYNNFLLLQLFFLLILLRLNLIYTKHNFFQKIKTSYLKAIYFNFYLIFYKLNYKKKQKNLYFINIYILLLLFFKVHLMLNIANYYIIKLSTIILFKFYIMYNLIYFIIISSSSLTPHLIIMSVCFIFNNYNLNFFQSYTYYNIPKITQLYFLKYNVISKITIFKRNYNPNFYSIKNIYENVKSFNQYSIKKNVKNFVINFF